jgi:hypothetical protein
MGVLGVYTVVSPYMRVLNVVRIQCCPGCPGLYRLWLLRIFPAARRPVVAGSRGLDMQVGGVSGIVLAQFNALYNAYNPITVNLVVFFVLLQIFIEGGMNVHT